MNQRPLNKTSVKRLSKWLMPLLVLLVLIGAVYWILNRSSSNTSSRGGSAQAAEAEAEADAKKQLIESGDNKGEQSGGQGGSSDSNDSTMITGLSARQETNGTVTIFTKLDSETSGKCQLTVQNGAKTVTKSADIIYQPEFSTCAGFSLPISGIGYGNWTISLAAGGSTKQISYEVSK